MLWGVCGGKTIAAFHHEVLLWVLKDKTIADFFLKLCCEAGLAKIIASLFLKNVMGVCGDKALADCAPEVFLWSLKDKTISDFFLKLCCEAGLAKIIAIFV